MNHARDIEQLEKEAQQQNLEERPRKKDQRWKERSRCGIEIKDEEVRKIARRMSTKQAPGPDGITSAAAKEMGLKTARWLAHIFSSCCKHGYWPITWKIGRLVLLPKGKTKSVAERAFRPLSIISCVAKILVQAVKSKILEDLKIIFLQASH